MAERNGGPTEEIETYVGSDDAVWHAVLTWSGGEAFTCVDGNDSAAVSDALQPSLFGDSRRVVVYDIHRVDRSVLGHRSVDHRVAGAIVGKAPGAKQAAGLRIITCDTAWAGQQVRRIAKGKGIALDARAERYLVETLSGDLGKIRSILSIASLCGATRLDEGQVRRLTGEVRPESKIYEVADAVFARDASRALDAAGDIEPYPMAAHLSEAVRTLWIAKACRNDKELAGATGIHPYVAKRRITQARGFAEAEIAAALEAACRAEIAVRRGQCGSREAVARVYLALCGGAAR